MFMAFPRRCSRLRRPYGLYAVREARSRILDGMLEADGGAREARWEAW
jgi:hypothetical protein